MGLKVRASRPKMDDLDAIDKHIDELEHRRQYYVSKASEASSRKDVKPYAPGEAKVKHKKGKLLCLVLKENKSCVFVYVKNSKNQFSLDRNTYFIESSGSYDRGSGHVAVYMEGVSLPIHHGLIEKETISKIITNLYGEEETHKITKIKGLKYDSELIDMLLNRKLADAFTKVHLDMPNLILAIALIVSIIVGVANLGVQFYLVGK